MYKFKFSVIMALYNVEEFFEEAVDSIIHQTIGFKEHIQLILINDGSPDNIEMLCKKYLKEYPDNITYYKKENGGVSSARNKGLEFVEGKYTIFFDGDDRWETDAFQEIGDFFDKHYDEVDIVNCKLKFFGDFSKKTHPLDYKYKEGNRVVDLEEYPKMVNATIGNIAIKTEAIKQLRFDEKLKWAEDALFQNTILLEKKKCGMLATAIFYYRRNINSSSASAKSYSNKDWYFVVPERYYNYVFDLAIQKTGEVPKFIQEIVMYDIKWRTGYREKVDEFTEEEKQRYLTEMTSVLRRIDDDVIASASQLDQYKKVYLLSLKHGQNILQSIDNDEENWYLDIHRIFSMNYRSFFEISLIDIEDGILRMQGMSRNHILGTNIDIVIENHKGQGWKIEFEPYEKADFKGFIGEKVISGQSFCVEMPVTECRKLELYAVIGDKRVRFRPSFGSVSGLDQSLRNTFGVFESYVVKRKKHSIRVVPKSIFQLLIAESKCLKEILIERKSKKKISEMLLKNYISLVKVKNQVAFVSFRSNQCLQGNEKALWESVTGIKKVVYAKMTPHRMRDKFRACRIIYGSKVVIIDDYNYLIRDYGKKKEQVFVQLWHACGAFKKFGQDGTSWFPPIDAKYHRNYDLVTVSSEHICEVYAQAFGIARDKVKALGCARTDMFYEKSLAKQTKEDVLEKYPQLKGKEVILYAPTFRDHPQFGRSKFCPDLDFKKLSENLLEDQMFVICPHPVIKDAVVEGDYDNILEIRDITTNDMMFVSDILITDYSSVIFEYALLQKPMAFFCYDFEQYNRDFYLDYEKDLPGQLLKTEEELFAFLKSDSRMELDEKYHTFNKKYMGACDGNSSKKIADAIQSNF